ncbi:MAG: hypothetical protein JJU11_15715 [Candidatus Sumerlaeia bacterium]|nr:hypothetical protein [Candidatus Sumerlaeia bacterium]
MMRNIFVSDMHLGDGGPLEDFLVWGRDPEGPSPQDRPAAVATMGGRFAAFLRQQLIDATASGFQPHLLLLGDTFDLWQVRRHRESDAAALKRILAAHPLVLKALRDWLAEGALLTILVGNHDQALVDRRAWALLAARLPGLNPDSNGEPVHWWVDEPAGIYAEHGNQWDPFNRLGSLTNPRATSVGYRLTRTVVNQIEPMVPLIDKGLGIEDILWSLWNLMDSDFPLTWGDLGGQLMRLVGRSPGPRKEVHREIAEVLQGKKERPDFDRLAASRQRVCERAIRRALSKRPGATLGEPPSQWRFLVSGHTHQADHARRSVRGREIEHLNCGTWTPRLERTAGGQRRMDQVLTYVLIEPDPGEGFSASRRVWHR